MVDGQQYHGFDELRLNHRPGNGHERLTGEYGRAFRHGPDIALEFEMPQIVQECFGKAAAAAEVFDIFVGEMQVFKVVDQLLNARHDGVAAAIRYAAEEHVKIGPPVGDAFFKIAMRHGELIEIGQHGQVFFCHCG